MSALIEAMQQMAERERERQARAAEIAHARQVAAASVVPLPAEPQPPAPASAGPQTHPLLPLQARVDEDLAASFAYQDAVARERRQLEGWRR